MSAFWQSLDSSRRRALTDLVVIGAVVLVLCLVGFLFNLPARIYQLAQSVGAGNGEIGFVFAVLTAGLVVFAIRRWRDLQLAQAEYQAVFENAPVGIFRATPDGRFLLANPALAHMLGYSDPHALLADVPSIWQTLELSPQQRAAYLQELGRDGIIRDFESQMRRRDGSVVWVLGNGRAARDAAGRITYLEGNLQDITVRQETEQVFRQLVEQPLQGITISRQGRLLFCNRAAAERLGYTVEEMLAFEPPQVALLVHPDDREMMVTRERDRMQGKSLPSQYVFQALRKDGAVRWLEANASQIEYMGLPSLLVMTVDVTERKAAQDAMQLTMQRTRMREEASAALARSGNDLRGVANNLARVVGALMGDLCVVSLRSADGMWVEPTGYAHRVPERQTILQAMYAGLRIPCTHPMVGEVFTQGEPLLIPHLDRSVAMDVSLAEFAGYIQTFGISSYLVVPMRHEGKIIGSVGVAREDGGAAYTMDDQMLLQELADRAGVAVGSAQLVAHLRFELDAQRAGVASEGFGAMPWRALADNAADLIVVLSAEGRILYISHAIRDGYGFEPEEMLGRHFNEFIHPEDRALAQSQIALLLSERHADYRAQAVRVRAKENGWRLSESVSVKQLDSPEPGTLMLDVRDVTDRDAREQTRMQVENAEREQRAFAQALADAAALLNRAGDIDQVLDGLLDIVARTVPYDTATIFMREGKVLRVARTRGFERFGLAEWIQGVTFSTETLRFAQLMERDIPALTTDTEDEANWVAVPETQWIRSNVAAPLRLGADSVGIISLDSIQPRFYRPAHATRLMTFADLATAALRNAQLLSEAQLRAHQLSLLYDVGLTLNRVLDPRTQLEFLFRIAQRALHSEDMAFFAYDGASELVRFELGVGIDADKEAILRAYPFSAREQEGIVGWTAWNRLPALVPDVDTDPRWKKVTNGARSVIAVPVEHEKELRGVLLAVRLRPEPFTAQDERLLILFANQAAAAMELARLFQAQAHRQRELEILREASLAFAATTDRATLTALILQFALRLVTALNAFLFFFENDRLEFGGTLWANNDPIDPSKYTPREDGLTYAVARGGEMIVVQDVNHNPLFSNWRWGGAIIGVPLKSGGQVRAVLNVAKALPYPFADQELRALELYADQAAAALENARRYQEMLHSNS